MLSELEGAILSEIHHRCRDTAFQVRRAFADSPSLEWRGSAGAVYSAVRRLEREGLIAAQPTQDGRSTRRLSVTLAGETALSEWACDPVRASSVGLDPFRLRAGIWTTFDPAQREAAFEGVRREIEANLAFLQNYLPTLDTVERARIELSMKLQAQRLTWLKRPVEDDPDLPGFDADGARAWLETLERQVEAPFRPRPDAPRPHPAALELRRLLALAPKSLPPAALVRLWREMEGVRLGGALRIAVWGGAQPELTIALARRRFGSKPRLALTREPMQAVMAAEAEGVVAVIAMEGAWWGRLLARPQVRVFAALHGEVDPKRPLALALTSQPIDATGGDVTYWVTDATAPTARIEAQLGDAGFAADPVAEAGGLKLFALAGYVQPHDARLAQAPGRLSGVIGASPIGLDP